MSKQLSLSTVQKVEVVKCGKNPQYFIRNYARIQHPLKGAILFETYPFQDDCLRDFEEHRFNIILKSRQLGLSTICAAYAVWLAIFHKDKNILVIATKLATAINFVRKCTVILQSLPKWLLLPKFDSAKQHINFDNGSVIKAVPTSEDAGRSEALSLLIVDEAAFIRDFDNIWASLSPTLSTGGQAIILSTPNGVGGQYYKLWTEAEAGINDFNPIRLPWTVHPEHDQEWFEKETRNLPKRKISQEFICDFITSGDTFLQPKELEMLNSIITPPIRKDGFDRNVWVWSEPIEGHQYVLSADVARGDAKDFSTFHIIDTTNNEVVVEYMGKAPPEKLTDMLDEWGRKYNIALVCPEQNSFGYIVCSKLRDDLAYPKLYYHNGNRDPLNYTPSEDELPGFPTQQKTRTTILTKMEELIRNGILKTYSQRLYDQLQAFVWVGNKPVASKDNHDDLVISLAIGCWMLEGVTGTNENALAMAMAMLKATRVDTRDTTHITNSYHAVQPLVNPNIKGSNPNSMYRPVNPEQAQRRRDNPSRANDLSDFSWLMK